MKQEMNGEALNIGEGVFPLLRQYPFMGNIRELRNIAERVYVLHEGSVITLEDMKEALYPTDLPGKRFRDGRLIAVREGSAIF